MALINVVDGVRAGRKRRSWSVAEKRRIVDESLVGGASIAEVARRHDLNANQLFTWRRRFGVVPQDQDPKEVAPILPVLIVTDTAASGHGKPGQMEIVLTGGERILVWGDVETAALARVLKAMVRP
jgi:transposase